MLIFFEEKDRLILCGYCQGLKQTKVIFLHVFFHLLEKRFGGLLMKYLYITEFAFKIYVSAFCILIFLGSAIPEICQRNIQKAAQLLAQDF
jgi:hypothetical protein